MERTLFSVEVGPGLNRLRPRHFRRFRRDDSECLLLRDSAFSNHVVTYVVATLVFVDVVVRRLQGPMRRCVGQEGKERGSVIDAAFYL